MGTGQTRSAVGKRYAVVQDHAEAVRLREDAIVKALHAEFHGFPWPKGRDLSWLPGWLATQTHCHDLHVLVKALAIARKRIGDHDALAFLSGVLAALSDHG